MFHYFSFFHPNSESGSESSEDSLQKRDDNKNDSQTDGKFDSYPIDAWRTDNFNNMSNGGDQKNFYRHSAEYDELNYQKVRKLNLQTGLH